MAHYYSGGLSTIAKQSEDWIDKRSLTFENESELLAFKLKYSAFLDDFSDSSDSSVKGDANNSIIRKIKRELKDFCPRITALSSFFERVATLLLSNEDRYKNSLTSEQKAYVD